MPGACEESDEVGGPTGTSRVIRGSVTLRDRRDETLDADGQPTGLVEGRVIASFADFSTVTSTPSALMALGSTCVGIISRPVSSGRPVRLDVANLEVSGSAAGVLAVTRTSTGVFSSSGAAPLLPGAGELSFRAGAGAVFPGFDERVPPVEPLSLLQPAASPVSLLEPEGLDVTWAPGSGDYVALSIAPVREDGSAEGGGQVVCVAADDGCFVVPPAAVAFLLASQTGRYTLSVERGRTLAFELDSGAGLELAVLSEVRVTLENGVLGP